MTLQQIIDTLKDAIYGKDVRAALVDLATAVKEALDSQVVTVDSTLTSDSATAAAQSKAVGDRFALNETDIDNIYLENFPIDSYTTVFTATSGTGEILNWSTPEPNVYRFDYYAIGRKPTAISLDRSQWGYYRFDVWVYASDKTELYRCKNRLNGMTAIIPNDESAYYFRIYVRRLDNDTLSESDKENIRNNLKRWYSSDPALTDANSAILNANNARNATEKEDTYHVKYSFTNGVTEIYGTNSPADNSSTGTSNFNTITYDSPNIPDWFQAGKPIYFDINRKDRTDSSIAATDDVTLQLRLLYQQTGHTKSPVVCFTTQESIIFTPTVENCEYLTGIVVRWHLGIGQTANSYNHVRILSAPSNIDIAQNVSKFVNDVEKLRVIQFNTGRFHWGDTDGSRLTDYEAGIITRNYKDFLAKYRPDVIGFEEYTPYLGTGSTFPAADIFGEQYINQMPASGPQTRCIMFSNKRMTNTRVVYVHGTGVTASTFIVSDMHLGAKTVAVATGYFSPVPDAVSARIEQFVELATALSDYKYAIILTDTNSAYYDNNGKPSAINLDTQQNTSLKQFLDTVKHDDYKYHPLLDLEGYWGCKSETYVSKTNTTPTHPTAYQSLDNILVKGNIKVQNFQILTETIHPIPGTNVDYYVDRTVTDAYTYLCSDHIPVMADLVIY